MAIIKTSAIESFTSHLNSQHKNIKWTRELESNRILAMLDTLITRKTDSLLKFSAYRKSSHTDQYLLFDSHQLMEHKMGVIRTLTHRSNTIITEEEDKEEEVLHIKESAQHSRLFKVGMEGSWKNYIHIRTRETTMDLKAMLSSLMLRASLNPSAGSLEKQESLHMPSPTPPSGNYLSHQKTEISRKTNAS